MTKLDDLLNIKNQNAAMQVAIKDTDDINESLSVIETDVSLANKIDSALPIISDIMKHDSEMDDIAKKAIDSYNDLCSMADNTPAMYSGKIYEVASTMLRTAMDAKEAKLQKKLKIIELQLKKLRIDKIKDDSGIEAEVSGSTFDRNDLLQMLKNSNTSKGK
jgi:glucosamine 6-phosphate synthetase-like amidotransferase/phosphosugar isomerase protein